MSEISPKATIAILERNRLVGQRIARVMSAASSLIRVAVADDPAHLGDVLSDRPVLLGCDVSDLELALEWISDRCPSLNLLVWTSGSTFDLLRAAVREPRLSNIVGWPAFASMPRAWEIAFAVRRITKPNALPPRLANLLGWGATIVKWRPRSSAERDRTVTEVAEWSERAGAPSRTAEQLATLAHELLMNAMYDAPIDSRGRPRYAHDRRCDITLDDTEVPTLRLGTDGEHIAVQAYDPFGRLQRHEVFEGILRGLNARNTDAGSEALLDTSKGGAGLGIFRIYAAGLVLVVDIVPNSSTTVTSFYDLDVNPREIHSLPGSIHFFERSTLTSEGGKLPAG